MNDKLQKIKEELVKLKEYLEEAVIHDMIGGHMVRDETLARIEKILEIIEDKEEKKSINLGEIKKELENKGFDIEVIHEKLRVYLFREFIRSINEELYVAVEIDEERHFKIINNVWIDFKTLWKVAWDLIKLIQVLNKFF